MSILHLVRRSGFSDNNLAQCLAALTPDDAIVLLDDGVYNLHHNLLLTMLGKHSHTRCYAIDEHATARAIKVIEPVKTINLAQLIELTFSHHTVITWQ